jgi:hypothetical protein
MILLAASIAMLAVIATRFDRLFADINESRATKLVRTLLWATSAIIAVEVLLGGSGLVTARNIFFGLATLALAVVALIRRPPINRGTPGGSPPPPATGRAGQSPAALHAIEPAAREPLSALDVGLAAALAAAFALRLWAGLHRTAFLYDTLSYHLHVPSTWMHERRLPIVPAVFGDPSPAYAPSNLELVFLFLMAPLRSDTLAGLGQLPFAALAVAAIVATVREAGALRSVALGAGLAFLLVPEVWTQAPTAMTDLGLAAFLLSSFPFASRLWRVPGPRRTDLVTIAVALGLAVGTKYAGAVLALPFLIFATAAIARARLADARGIVLFAAALLATGGFWYVQNAVIAGNPFYPIAAVPGLPLPALYGGKEMRAWDYHVPISDLGELGSMVIASGIAFSGASVLAIARLWRTFYGALAPVLVAVFWLLIPYQESRFLFAAFGAAAIAIGIAVPRKPTLTIWLFGLVAALIGSLLQFPTRERLLLAPIGGVAATLFVYWRHVRFRPSIVRAAFTAAAFAASIVIAARISRHDVPPARYTVDDDDLAAAWAWVDANVSDADVAYTGTNLAFPLAGARLANRVRYVNVTGAPGDRLHDFGPPGDGTPEPAPYRRGASPGVWMSNLRATGTRVLFVAALYPVVRRTIAADSDGFPVERAWADAHPDVFRLRFANAAARVYDVEIH